MLVSQEAKKLLAVRWRSLPDQLKLGNQMVGQYWTQCGFTMGPSYCSFGCSHCYLPASANRQPMPGLEQMKAQVDANRQALGPGGNLQITGGDVVDAYVRSNRHQELVEIIAYCVSQDLVPMIMTHGQSLMRDPDYLVELVREGGLRKISCHIDITQAGRQGYPIKNLESERQLNPVRDQLVELVLDTRARTGKALSAAQTVTVTSKNRDSLHEVFDWLFSKPQNMDVTRTLGVQTEASVGRTLSLSNRVSPEQVWDTICDASGMQLPRDGLLYGHPKCTSTALLLVAEGGKKKASLITGSAAGRRFWEVFPGSLGGLAVKGNRPLRNILVRTVRVLFHPGLIAAALRFALELFRSQEIGASFLWSWLRGRTRGVNIVMHNFMDQQEVAMPQDPDTPDRLRACTFRGAVMREGQWQQVPMCEINAVIRPEMYDKSCHQLSVSRGCQ